MDSFSDEELMKNEIELLKLKLEVEKGAVIHLSDDVQLPTELELEWLQHVYNYENLCKNAGYSKIVDVIGNPDIAKSSEISTDKINVELESLHNLLYENGIDFSYLENCYSPYTIYKFITEELFEESICLYRGSAGNGFSCFIYEEFYPNHEYDLKFNTMNYLKDVFGEGQWDSEILKFTHEENIHLNGYLLTLEEYSNCITRFKKHYPALLFENPEIKDVKFDMQTQKAEVQGTISMTSRTLPYIIRFNFSYTIWVISEVQMDLL